MAYADERVRRRRRAGQQRRHPACRAGRGLPGRHAGTRSSRSTSARPSTRRGWRCRACAASNWGRIINIASAHGLVASAQKSAYVAAKHGIVGLTKSVALETATTGITVNAICPGWVLTPLVQKQVDARAAADGIDDAEAQAPAAGREAAVAAVHDARAARRAGGVPVLAGGRQRARRRPGRWTAAGPRSRRCSADRYFSICTAAADASRVTAALPASTGSDSSAAPGALITASASAADLVRRLVRRQVDLAHRVAGVAELPARPRRRLARKLRDRMRGDLGLDLSRCFARQRVADAAR